MTRTLDPSTHGRANAYVLGIDPSLTGTGVARVHHDGAVQVRHFGRKGKRAETLTDRRARIQELYTEALTWGLGWQPAGDDPVRDPQLAVIEAPSHGSVGGSAWDRAHLWWSLVAGIGPPLVATVAPATRAKWATGSGKGDKAAVSAALQRIWPDVDIDCTDCADALALATMAAQHLGWDVPTLQRHSDALAGVKWTRLEAG